MIKGLGVDIVENNRFNSMKHSEQFIKRYYTADEIKLIEERGVSIAIDNFAVKEAVSKVLGTGFRRFGLTDIEVLRDPLGKPYVNLYGAAKEISDALGINTFFISISNTKELSVATVVAEG